METINALWIYEEPEMALAAIKFKTDNKIYSLDMDQYAGEIEIERKTEHLKACIRIGCKRKLGFEQFIKKLEEMTNDNLFVTLEFRNSYGSSTVYSMPVKSIHTMAMEQIYYVSLISPEGIDVQESGTFLVDYLIEE